MEGTRHKKSHGVKETIVRRGGDPALRTAANKHLALVGGLEDDLKKCQNILNDAERHLRKEQNKHNKVEAALEKARNSFSAAQEIIDADPLPEKAQPVSRIQQRDTLRLVCMCDLTEESSMSLNLSSRSWTENGTAGGSLQSTTEREHTGLGGCSYCRGECVSGR